MGGGQMFNEQISLNELVHYSTAIVIAKRTSVTVQQQKDFKKTNAPNTPAYSYQKYIYTVERIVKQPPNNAAFASIPNNKLAINDQIAVCSANTSLYASMHFEYYAMGISESPIVSSYNSPLSVSAVDCGTAVILCLSFDSQDPSFGWQEYCTGSVLSLQELDNIEKELRAGNKAYICSSISADEDDN